MLRALKNRRAERLYKRSKQQLTLHLHLDLSRLICAAAQRHCIALVTEERRAPEKRAKTRRLDPISRRPFRARSKKTPQRWHPIQRERQELAELPSFGSRDDSVDQGSFR